MAERTRPEIGNEQTDESHRVRFFAAVRHGAVDVDPELSRFGLPRDGHVGPGFCGDGQSVL